MSKLTTKKKPPVDGSATAAGAASGAAAGASAGIAGGPVGVAAGAVIGGAVGAATGAASVEPVGPAEPTGGEDAAHGSPDPQATKKAASKRAKEQTDTALKNVREGY